MNLTGSNENGPHHPRVAGPWSGRDRPAGPSRTGILSLNPVPGSAPGSRLPGFTGCKRKGDGGHVRGSGTAGAANASPDAGRAP